MLTFEFVPYHEIDGLVSAHRIQKLIDLVKENSIVLLEGRLRKQEEADLIAQAMEEIRINKKFKGIELAVIDFQAQEEDFVKRLRDRLVGMLLGDKQGFTVIGPATIVKEIKKDPNKIQMFMNESNGKRKK